jgi:hypothetical protein
MDYNSSVTKVLVLGQGSLRYTGDHAGLPYWQFERELKRYLALRLHEPSGLPHQPALRRSHHQVQGGDAATPSP